MTRYEEITGFKLPLSPRDGRIVPHVQVVRCLSCGSLLLESDEKIHERMHPTVSCEKAHPTMAIYCTQPHKWEDQFR